MSGAASMFESMNITLFKTTTETATEYAAWVFDGLFFCKIMGVFSVQAFFSSSLHPAEQPFRTEAFWWSWEFPFLKEIYGTVFV